MGSLAGCDLLKQMVLIKYFKPHIDVVFWSHKQCYFFARAVVRRRSLFCTPWACKLNSTFNRKVTKYFLCALKSLTSKCVLWCGLGKKKKNKKPLICSRNVIWESVQNFCCLNLPNLHSFLDLRYCALKSILITTSHACSDVPFLEVSILEKRSGCVFTK